MTVGSKPLLRIIIGSTRPGRIGLPIGNWLRDQAIAHGGFRIEVTDLYELDLPLMDEPNHPSQQKYTQRHTIDWSDTIAATDAVVWVMPEYNHSFTAPVKNAIDYLVKEWAHKPVGLASYGGISGGLRAAQAIKPVLTALRMSVVSESVVIQFVGTLFDDNGQFVPSDSVVRSVPPMLDEMLRQVPILKQLQR
jgi:NAD(P)H-dependent FMN reductase